MAWRKTNGAAHRLHPRFADVHMTQDLWRRRLAYGEAVWSWHPLLASNRRRIREPYRANETTIRR
jgi:hypothetical protein